MWKSFDRGFTPFMDSEQKVEDWGDDVLFTFIRKF